jgi:hypothetical protein
MAGRELDSQRLCRIGALPQLATKAYIVQFVGFSSATNHDIIPNHTLLPKLLPVPSGMNQILQQSLSKGNTNKNQKTQLSS